jgi:hypothetical protein
MIVKTIRPIEFPKIIIPEGIELTVLPLFFLGEEAYKVTEGFYKNYIFKANHCTPINDQKVYTEKEMKAIESVHLAKLDKERAAKDRAIDLVTNMSKQLVKKNAEIEKLEFCVSALSIGLSASSEAIQVLREKEKV